jgi:hypothetical protein
MRRAFFAETLTGDEITSMEPDRTLEYEILREMSPAKKLDVMHALIRQARELKAAAIRASEPELTSAEVDTRIREIWALD